MTPAIAKLNEIHGKLEGLALISLEDVLIIGRIKEIQFDLKQVSGLIYPIELKDWDEALTLFSRRLETIADMEEGNHKVTHRINSLKADIRGALDIAAGI